MITFEKTKKVFTILNVSDIQLSDSDIVEKNDTYQIVTETVKTVFEKSAPNIIVHTGDLSYAEMPVAYDWLGGFFEDFGVPFTTVWAITTIRAARLLHAAMRIY